MLSSVCFFLVTIVDGIFIGHGVGTNGLGAINLVMPFVRSYGAREEKERKSYFHASLAINFVGSLIINVLLLFMGDKICMMFGADQEPLAFAVKAMPMLKV